MADSFNIEMKGVQDLLKTLTTEEREVLPEAAVRAMNSTATTVRSEAVKVVAARMGLKQKTVRDRINIVKARELGGKAGGVSAARIQFPGRRLNLIHFKARQFKKGVKASPGGERQMYPGSFIATINGKRLVMVRKSRGGKRVGRLPIKALKGLGIAGVAADPELSKQRMQLVQKLMPERLRREIDYLVKKKRRGSR